MRLNDFKNKLLKSFSRGGNATGSSRPDGGTSCYRPIRKKTQAEIREQEEPQPLTYIHTGFTGMNPPSDDFGGNGWNPQPYAQTAYGQPGPFNAPGYGPMQPGYDQPQGYGPQGYNPGNTGYAPQGYAPQQPAYEPSWQPAPTGRIRTEEAPATAARPERGWFPPREEAAPRSNISYMPGYAPDAGAAPFSHVEHIMTLTGLKSCYEAIECMKNGETLIVSLDAIANENESMRCQDMLAGAAFTLGCSVRMLQGGRLVLIAPEGVKILPEEAPGRAMNGAVPPVYTVPVQPMQSAQPEPAPRPRERRSGRNAADWTAAVNGQMDNYNPYTGTMPAAAGSYGSFGGYGY